MNRVKVIRRNNYFTLVAAGPIFKGETVLTLSGKVISVPDKYSLQIGENKHLLPFSDNPEDPASAFRFINHSCSPNSYFDIPSKTLLALKDIPANEEVLFHYCTTEYDMAHPFSCSCGSANCLKEIKGFSYLPLPVKNELNPFLAPHLKKHLMGTSL